MVLDKDGRAVCSRPEVSNIAVYTAIFNGYDNLVPVSIVGDSDYICFSNCEIDVPHPWKLRIVDMPHPDPRFASRYYFDQSTVVLPEYEYTIMHSGSSVLSVLPETLLSYLQSTDIAAFKHPSRATVYQERDGIIQTGKDTRDNTLEQVTRYLSEGFSGFPLSACTLLIRRNTPAIQKLEKFWWREVSNGSHRDQLSFDYARWKCGVEITYIPGDVFRSPILRRGKHVRKLD